ncbi:MAG TPA: glucokinase, partial [Vicinamibacteria bacterium]
MTEELILAADVGATKAILGLFAARDTGVPVEVRQVPSQDYDSLEALVRDVYPGGAPAEVGCFGIPGPVLDGTSSVTNLGWTVHEADLVRTLGLRQAILINDVAAMAYGIPLVAPERMLTLNVGCARPSSNAALLAVGTGLGEAILAWTGREHVPMSGEGGHADLAPRNPLEIELLQYLQRSAEHVGWER